MGPHGDCGLRDSVCRRLLAGGWVQLFYLCALYFLVAQVLFDFRLSSCRIESGDVPLPPASALEWTVFVLTHPSKVALKMTSLKPAQTRLVGESNAMPQRALIPWARCRSTTWYVRRPDPYDEVLLIQNRISSDTWLWMQSRRPPRLRGRTLIGSPDPTSY